MNNKKNNLSSAIQLINIVWGKSFQVKPHSWRILNSSLQCALSLAIRSGMKFNLNDFQYIAGNFRFGYWGYNDGHMLGEGFYKQTICNQNLSASQSFEFWKHRQPLIFKDISYWTPSGNKMFKECRLAVGASLKWQREEITVTSFSEEGDYIIACSYHPQKEEEYVRKVKQRYKITRKDLRAEKKRLEEDKTASTSITASPTEG